MALFVYLGVCRVTLENRPVECRDSSVCLSLLGCFPRTQEALNITLAKGRERKKIYTIANHSRRMLGLRSRSQGGGTKSRRRRAALFDARFLSVALEMGDGNTKN